MPTSVNVTLGARVHAQMFRSSVFSMTRILQCSAPKHKFAITYLPTKGMFLRANGLGQSDRRKVERLSHRPTDFVCRQSSRIVSAHLFKSFKFNLCNPINSDLNSKILMRRYVPQGTVSVWLGCSRQNEILIQVRIVRAQVPPSGEETGSPTAIGICLYGAALKRDTSFQESTTSTMRDPRFANGIGVLKRDDNPSKMMNSLDDRLHGTRKMLCWFLNLFEKIVVKHLHKSLKIHTSQIRRLRKSIRRKRPQFWQSDYWYLMHDNAPTHRSQLVKEFLAKARTDLLPYPLNSPDLIPCDLYQIPSMRNIYRGTVLCLQIR
ncbi:hypothetical protein TNCV_451311 [Trichonephila clavipes]|nr:hypothetical protein TNCV_451311 [Trichonephila clavipes]